MSKYFRRAMDFVEGTGVIFSASMAGVIYLINQEARIWDIYERLKGGCYIGFGKMVGSEKLIQQGEKRVRLRDLMEICPEINLTTQQEKRLFK